MRMTQMANHFRFHRPHLHLHSPFGDDWFGRRAESFARFFGTPRYLLMQTVLVLCWIALNAMGTLRSDPYPFILLNLLFSTQAAYAAPLILLAQTRQADREKAHAEADARHREGRAASARRAPPRALGPAVGRPAPPPPARARSWRPPTGVA